MMALPIATAEIVGSFDLAASRSLDRRSFTRLAIVSPLAAVLGCAGYRMGARTLYPPDIETVYVPMIESNSYRRNLGEWLTEAVIKLIETDTPFKVVNTPNADSVLSCRITSDSKNLAMNSPTSEGRELRVNFQVSVDWLDRKGDAIKPGQSIPAPAGLNSIQDGANMFPELGQSITSSQQTGIQRLAEQIVSMMEAAW
jgi:lipopolysaccharide assembly LptE-like protein